MVRREKGVIQNKGMFSETKQRKKKSTVLVVVTQCICYVRSEPSCPSTPRLPAVRPTLSARAAIDTTCTLDHGTEEAQH
eukprot:6467795-Amphidinium_carterae.1